MKSTRLSLTPNCIPTPLWSALLRGADGDEAGGQGGSQDGGAGTGDGEGAAAGKTTDESSSTEGDPQKKILALTDEKDRHFAARTKAEKERDDALARLKEIDDKDKTELQLKTDKVEELTGTVTSLQETNRVLALENAFLKDNSFKWQDPAVALRLVDLSKVDIKEGKVTGLADALKALAESSPFLLQKDESGDDAKDKDAKKRPPASGDAPGSRRSDDKGAAAEAERLRRKYPALRGR